jgi:hypothetical protein
MMEGLDGYGIKERRELCDKVRDMVRDDANAVARVRYVLGGCLEDAQRPRDAIEVYADAALDALGSSQLFALVDRAAHLQIDMGDLEAAIDLHDKVFDRLNRPPKSALVPGTRWFRIGLRLAKLHKLAGDDRRHDSVIDDICDRVVTEDDAAEQRLRERFERLEHAQVTTVRAPRMRRPGRR